ncbi:MAG: flavodoxin domain-containing protein [Gemmatimonadota bacterium]
MNGAIVFSGRYGSTAQYSQWISEATGLPVFDLAEASPDLTRYDFLVLGSSVVFFRATIRKWLKAHWPDLEGRHLILFTVSGAADGPKLRKWIAKSFPKEVLAGMQYVALRGRLKHEDVSWWLRILLKIGALMNPDREAAADEMHGFDYMDRDSIEPIVSMVERLQSESGVVRAGRGSSIRPYGSAQLHPPRQSTQFTR